jgi:hypothetical protein
MELIKLVWRLLLLFHAVSPTMARRGGGGGGGGGGGDGEEDDDSDGGDYRKNS